MTEQEANQEHLVGAIPFLGEIKKLEEIMHLVETIKAADANGNGHPDWQDLMGIVTQAAVEINKFKGEVAGFTLANLVPETQAFFTSMTALYTQAETIVGSDLEAFKKQFPDIFVFPTK